MRELCRRFGITPRTGYKWRDRFVAEGSAALAERSRCPHLQPRLTGPEMTERVLQLRRSHPAWGGAKLRARLLKLGVQKPPSASTITEILRRNGLLDTQGSAGHAPFIRFEHAAPNDLWQMDFKGHFAIGAERCHPLTAIDDHSRYALLVEACGDERGQTVQRCLRRAFQNFGLPWRMLMDNGSPWGNGSSYGALTLLEVWLLRLGISVSHGKPAHPQTQGKEERFNRTLKSELLCRVDLRDLRQCQREFEKWRHIYNHERPHHSLGYSTPASRYRASARSFPSKLPPIEYGPEDIVKKVKSKGEITHKNQFYYIGAALAGLPIALRPCAQDGLLDVYFCHQKIGRVNLREKEESKWTYQSIQI